MKNLPLYISEAGQSILILVGVVAFMGIIVLGVILFKKKFHKFDIEKPEISDWLSGHNRNCGPYY